MRREDCMAYSFRCMVRYRTIAAINTIWLDTDAVTDMAHRPRFNACWNHAMSCHVINGVITAHGCKSNCCLTARKCS